MGLTPSEPDSSGPVAETQRIASLDVLRGLGVLGILVMNIQSFSMVGAAYMNPTAYGDLSGANHVVWFVSHVLFDQKFMTIFSMLFGAGIVLMTERHEARGVRPGRVHFRRMGLLLLFGLAHAYLLWYGDILVTYALCGLVVYFLRRCHPRTLLVCGVLGLAIASFVWLLVNYSMPFWTPEDFRDLATAWAPSVREIEEELATYRGGWLGQMPHRAKTALTFQTLFFVICSFWRVGGLMLIGMALFKMGVLNAARPSKTYATMIAVAVLIGVPIILFGAHLNATTQWAMKYSFFLGGQFNYWASLPVSLGWVGLVMLACRHRWVPPITATLAAVGRMALTNYLLQTVICTTIFYGQGFGMFGRVERVGQLFVVLGVWAFQLTASVLWLRGYRLGPMEWLWRSLTYRTVQPMRRG